MMYADYLYIEIVSYNFTCSEKKLTGVKSFGSLAAMALDSLSPAVGNWKTWAQRRREAGTMVSNGLHDFGFGGAMSQTNSRSSLGHCCWSLPRKTTKTTHVPSVT